MKKRLMTYTTALLILAFPAKAQENIAVKTAVKKSNSSIDDVLNHNYKLIRDHIQKDFSKEFVQGLVQVSNIYQKAKDKIGLEELAKIYAKVQITCLDYAEKSNLPEYERIRQDQKEMDKLTGNTINPDKESIMAWAEKRTDFFQKLLSNKEKAKDFSDLITMTFPTKQDYNKDYLEAQLKATIAIYDSLRKQIDTTSNNFLSILNFVTGKSVKIGLKQVKKAQEVAVKVYTQERDIVYKTQTLK